jgi:hypothetical protein
MTVRVRYRFVPQISSDALEARDLGNAFYEVVSDLMTEGGSWKAIVPAGSVNVEIPFPGITSASFLVVRTTSVDPTLPPTTITLRKNSTAGENIDITPFGNKEGLLVLTTSGITAVYASNASSSTDMQLTFFVAGV